MSLADRLNRALVAKKLQPTVRSKPVTERTVRKACNPGPKGSPGMYPTLEAGIRAGDSIQPDEFGTRVVVVEKIEELGQTLFQLPMIETIVGKYIVDDIQKRTGGGYEVHLVEKNQR